MSSIKINALDAKLQGAVLMLDWVLMLPMYDHFLFS